MHSSTTDYEYMYHFVGLLAAKSSDQEFRSFSSFKVFQKIFNFLLTIPPFSHLYLYSI